MLPLVQSILLLLSSGTRAEIWEPELVAWALETDPSVSIYLDDFTRDGCLTNQDTVRDQLALRLGAVFDRVEQGGSAPLHYTISVHGAALPPAQGNAGRRCSCAIAISYQAWLPAEVAGDSHQVLITVGPSKLYSGVAETLDDIVMEAAIYTAGVLIEDLRSLSLPRQ